MSEARNKRRIGVVTTSRADYSHLYWPLRELAAHPQVELGVFALGPHLSPQFGSTIHQIERDGFPIRARIECLLSSDTDTGMAKTIGLAILGLADAFTAWRPDLLLLIADRYEMLAPASAALAMRIPVAHIEGGEVSQGAIDDQVRNALTKLSHVHFTSTDMARNRVIAMGEEPWRVHRAGAPSLDHLRRSQLLDRAALETRLGITLAHPSLLAAWHPVTILADTNAEAGAFFSAMEQVDGQVIFVYPNSDAGSHALIQRTTALAGRRPDTRIFVNLDAVTYWSLLGQVDVMVGNSSSGIMEAASFALPVVNVGMRQQGRERARNVIDAPAETGPRPHSNRSRTRSGIQGLPARHGKPVWRWNGRAHDLSGSGQRSHRRTPDQEAGSGSLGDRPRKLPGASMTFRIPLSAPDVGEAEIAAVTAVLRTPQLSMGSELKAFEAELARYHSVPDAVVVSSGTAALHLALLTLGVGPGHEVILPSFAFLAVANVVHHVGASPVFAEIDPITLNLDAGAVERAITPRTRAIIAVHTFGIPADIKALRSIADGHGLVLIEDACEAIGAELDGRRVGGFGDLAVLGFYPNKQITTGEGGAVLVRNPAHAPTIRRLRNQGRDGQGWLDQREIGYNYRLSELECALGRVQLERIDEILEKRRAAAERYHSLLQNIPHVELPPLVLPHRTISWFVYVVRLTSEAVRVQSHLAERGIATGRYFAPIHLQPPWRFTEKVTELRLTEEIARSTLALPLFNRITIEQQREVISALRDAILSDRTISTR